MRFEYTRYRFFFCCFFSLRIRIREAASSSVDVTWFARGVQSISVEADEVASINIFLASPMRQREKLAVRTPVTCVSHREGENASIIIAILPFADTRQVSQGSERLFSSVNRKR